MAQNEQKKEEKKESPIIIKKIKKHAHGHHGGSWKIAFADFVTAMMAFFLLMWLLASLNKAQRAGVADYFKQPLRIALISGNSTGAQKITIKGGGDDTTQKDGQVRAETKPINESKPSAEVEKEGAKEEEIKQLETLKKNIMNIVANDPSLAELKEKMDMEITKEGLRIQLIDNKNHPMFEASSDEMSPEIQLELVKITKLLNQVNKKISIQGHTDAHPFQNPDEKVESNWDLSANRANAARRALIKAGLDENKIVRVSGYASTVLLDKKNPFNPNNRRISIIVMKKDAENRALEKD